MTILKQKLMLTLLIPVFSGMLCACGIDRSDGQAETAVVAFDSTGWEEEKIDHESLATWPLLGEGSVFTIMNGQTCLAESDETQGVMLLSPASYTGDVVIRYKALALTEATVLVTILSAADTTGVELQVPDDYDGGMGLWTGGTKNYFFAFKNAPHGGTPFIAKNPGFDIVANALEQDRMVAGIYYDIEVGRQGTALWLSVDGRRIVHGESSDALGGGHVALRLRGTAGIKASALIKDLTIYSR